MDTERAIEELLALPQLKDSSARGRFFCGEIADAATYLAEDIAEFRVSITEEQRQALLRGISEYAHGDQEVFSAYARLLESSDSEAM
ncbi:hypothetical protein [Corynebacterium lactis]|uniref:Uncharacterized protein n=1 Tax=Corynebacterium lactis RW2-5 TaxID=1408189 RepID=A0A0K2H4B5_9CORY|nr:hypothetical protein [Corynebacterium lactis]ALA68556.1 hypothetical protein CLAC_07340 [Corynebacterium lactis RW2-5]